MRMLKGTGKIRDIAFSKSQPFKILQMFKRLFIQLTSGGSPPLSHTTRTWARATELNIGRSRADKRKCFFKQCMVNCGIMESLAQNVIMVTDLDDFKRRLDKSVQDKAINGY